MYCDHIISTKVAFTFHITYVASNKHMHTCPGVKYKMPKMYKGPNLKTRSVSDSLI